MFIRHCESTYQAQIYPGSQAQRQSDQRYLDAELTETGKLQAAKLGVYLEQQWKPDLIVSSPLTRCLETAAFVFPRLSTYPLLWC